MAISWDQVENGQELRTKILTYSNPKFNHVEQFAPNDGQTVFNLSYKPTEDIVKVYINGLVYYENIHFTVNRTTTIRTLTWTYDLFSIEQNDLMYIDYWSYDRE